MREKLDEIVFRAMKYGTNLSDEWWANQKHIEPSLYTDQILSLLKEEIRPHLEKIDKLTSDIEGDWTDPRYECDKISEEIQAILKIVEEK